LKHRIESLDKETTKKEIEFGESQKALAEYNQTLDEVDSWLSRAENQTFDEEETDELSLPNIMAICVESSSNDEQINGLCQLNDNPIVCEQDVFRPSMEKLENQKKRQEDITDWISTKTKLIDPSELPSAEPDISSSDEDNRSSLNPSWSSLLYRGVRIVLPIHALMLLALGISSIAEFDAVYSVACTVQNTVKHSFEPLLSWPNGPPPY
jgi:hypothetical protein